MSNASTKYNPELFEYAKQQLATGDDLAPEIFPELYNVSSGFIFRFVPRPTSITCPEFVYVPYESSKTKVSHDDWIKYRLLIAQWNMLWETGQLRYEFFEDSVPTELSWLARFRDYNLYLLPDAKKRRYDVYTPLFHLLPHRTLQKYRLPALRRGLWPPTVWRDDTELLLEDDFEAQLSTAFAHHVWPLLSPGSRIEAFSKDDSIILLSHNLDYWLPFAYSVAEERLRAFPRVSPENTEQEKKLDALQRELPNDVKADFPLCGGIIWAGEKDSWDATKELVEVADRNGKLRGIIEAIRSNRVEDDFSDR